MTESLIRGYRGIAKYLNLSVATVKNEVGAGRLPAFRSGHSKEWYARPNALDAYAEDRSNRPTRLPTRPAGRQPITDPAILAARIKDREAQTELYRQRRLASAQAQREAAQAERSADPDLLYGMRAIGRHIDLAPRQVDALKANGELPTFKLGGRVCARRSTLSAFFAEKEASALTGGGKSRRPGRAPGRPASVIIGATAIAERLGINERELLRLDSERLTPTYMADGKLCALATELDIYRAKETR